MRRGKSWERLGNSSCDVRLLMMLRGVGFALYWILSFHLLLVKRDSVPMISARSV